MNRHHILRRQLRRMILTIFCVCALTVPQTHLTHAAIGDMLPFIILSCDHASLPIDGQVTLLAFTSDGSMPRFSSSKSSVASVNTYGVVTGKKSGTCTITAKIRHAEASCKITVEKSTVTISKASVSLENGETIRLSAKVSTGHDVKWKSSSSAVASVDEDGFVTAKKCGSAVIRATADGVSAKCKITVRKPKLTMKPSRLYLYPDDTYRLEVTCSSNRPLTFRSSSSAVVSVDENGWLTAHKKGTATITVRVDGVSRTCRVTVKPSAQTL